MENNFVILIIKPRLYRVDTDFISSSYLICEKVLITALKQMFVMHLQLFLTFPSHWYVMD